MPDDQQDKHPGGAMETLPAPSAEYVAKAEARSLDFMNPKRWQVMNVMAQTFLQSNALPASIKNAPQLIMVFQAGYEAGLQPLESLNSYYFVNGKLALYGEMAIALVRRANHKIEWGTCNATTATVKITRHDTGESMETTFTMEQARQRGLSSKDVWQKYPENMLKFKAFHNTARFICPDALHGVPIKEEIEGEVVDESGQTVSVPKGTKAKKVTVETNVTAPADHKPLDQTLAEQPADTSTDVDQDEDEGETKPGESKARKAMKRGMKKDKVGESFVPAGSTFVLTGDKEKDEKLYNAIIEDELNGMKLGTEQKKFLAEFNEAYKKAGA